MRYVPDNNLAYPIKLVLGGSTGSGFLCVDQVAGRAHLVTAKHVLFDAQSNLIAGQATVLGYGSDLTTRFDLTLNCTALLGTNDLRAHPTADVALIHVSSMTGAATVAWKPGVSLLSQLPPGVSIVHAPVSHFRKVADVLVSNDAVLFGYPASVGIGQIDHTRPLLRRGNIAGKTHDNRIVLDCPVYQGNSGGLVLEREGTAGGGGNFFTIGIASQFVPFTEELESKQYRSIVGIRYENSGYSIAEPIDRVLELF